MRKLSDVRQRELKWEQPSALQMAYELRAGAEVVGTLQFRSAFGTLATAQSGDGCWTFKRVGFWQTRVSVRACGSETDLAVFRNNTWDAGGTLEFPDGRRFKATTNFWSTNYEVRTEADEPVLRFRLGGVLHASAQVELLPGGAAVSELPLLIPLGWYLALMMMSDSAVAAAAAAS